MTVRDTAVAIADDLRRGDTDFALRMLARAVAGLRAAADDDLADYLAEPPTTGDRRWDTLLAATVSHECRLPRRPRPGVDQDRTAHVVVVPGRGPRS